MIRAVGVLLLVSIGLFARPAQAQALVKPKMMVVFDSSGSMTWTPRRTRACQWQCGLPVAGQCAYRFDDPNGCAPGVPCGADGLCMPYTYGDGSARYPGLDVDGDGQSHDSRMFIAKEALATTLFGAAELEFGLMRYGQLEGNLIRSTCSNAQCWDSWYDQPPVRLGEGAINYDGVSVSCDEGGQVLVDIGAEASNDIYQWIDHREDFPYDPTGDRELRGDGLTPIAASLRDARAYFLDQVIPNDPRRSCRSYSVLLLTDGEETCEVLPNGRPDVGRLVSAAEGLADLRFEGQPTPVRTFVIGFGEDTLGSPVLDQIAEAGGTNAAFFADDQVSLQLALAEIIQQAIPQELCNGEDDDCDGQIDEGLLRACASACGGGTEICTDGAWGGCSARQPEAERCNGEDDDCDGQADEGALDEICETDCGPGRRICDGGALQRCDAPTPADEVCNGQDDDCDGATDEQVSVACQTACGNGARICAEGVLGPCDAPTPQPETCDGTDEDCDGNLDEGLQRACENACGAGVETCNDGAWLGCTARQPGPEICDGRDNDCDGQMDEGLVQACQTACGVGQATCRNGRWADCDAPQPSPEVCNNRDDDCDGLIDDSVTERCVTACGQGVRVCAAGAFGACSAPEPSAEICDGQDQDCDGRVDEQVVVACDSACGQGIRRCENGALGACNAPAPRAERCDGEDEDCDGRIDEGVTRVCRTACGAGIERCAAGVWAGCDAPAVVPEVCNNRDDDCDGRTDENAARVCENACGEGLEQCVDGRHTGECDAPQPADELCDGVDNDCDGTIDEALRRDCSTLCGAGAARCEAGRWVDCTAQQPRAEGCNEIDDDCDGEIDENVTRSCFSECGRGQEVCRDGAYVDCDAPEQGEELCNGLDDDCDGRTDEQFTVTCQTPCGAGVIRCVDGALTECSAAQESPEICDGLDNDCDGVIDNADDLCDAGTVCLNGACAEPCDNGECPGGLTCVQGHCTRDPCDGIDCGDGFCQLGRCISRDCIGVPCEGENVCSQGVCAPDDCYLRACPGSQICVDGACVADPCLGVACDEGRFCREGACVGSCAGVQCPADQRCRAGACVAAPCANRCPDDQACVAGACVPDPCVGVRCPEHRVCEAGACVVDPCLNVVCPEGEACLDAECVAEGAVPDLGVADLGVPLDRGVPDASVDGGVADAAQPDQSPDAEPGAPPEDGGCNCDAGGDGAPSPWFALLAGALLVARPRRRGLLALLPLLLLACDDDSPPGVRDAGPQIDAGPRCDATGRPITPEICDFADNDCDGRTDEGYDLMRDPAHCGVCDNACAVPNGTGVCQMGECAFAGCDEGFYDGDGDPTNGCEARCDAEIGPEACDGRDNDCDGTADEDFDLEVDLNNCGACGVACQAPDAETTCSDGQCVIARCTPGTGDFDGVFSNGCEAPCLPERPGPDVCDGEDNDCDGRADEDFDLSQDGEHCGQCNTRCAYANGTGACRDSACALVGCEPGFVDADGDAENGCEARCTPDASPVEICDERDNDCNGVVDDGIDKQTDVENCGGCGALDERFICRLPNADVACAAGACAIAGCHPGFADFDGDPANGCEGVCVPNNGGVEQCNSLDDDCDGQVDETFDRATDVAHCGACNARCETGNAEPACVDGRCEIGACPVGLVDADRNPRNGCEYACTPTADATEICDHLDNDCDGVIDEGFDIFNDPAHCGSCDARCDPPNALAVCNAGVCDIGGCDEGWFDADFMVDNGCEIECTPSDDGFERCDGEDNDCDGATDEDFDLDRDVLHCGACDQPCGLPNGISACVDGACRDVGCAEGWYDLDGERGCEYRCVPADPPLEACNGADDDCDGQTDEGFDLQRSLAHCGACGVACAGPNGVYACQAGTCALTACAPGFVDANDDPVDGCELACDPEPDGREICNGKDDDCDGLSDEGFDLLNDAAHCGGCGIACAPANGAPFCNAGRCAVLRCDEGFVDVNGRADDGCECALSNGGVEICDGLDNDCNGVVDDADRVVPPVGVSCGGRGVCRGVRPACRAAAWLCPYPATHEADGETRCDGLDNDCDGRVDEPFPELDTPCAVGVGACRDEGQVECVALDRAECTARAHPERAEPEICDDVDNDCDGRTDEHSDLLVRVPAGDGVAAFEIYAFEASRTDADALAAGQSFARACSKAGAQPWANVNQATAAAACAAAGMRLCSAAEWQRACAGNPGHAFPYGPDYRPLSCNGHDFDTDGLTPGNQDAPLPSGSLNQCRRVWLGDGVYDLSGNLWEWTSEPLAGGSAHGLRGGSFGNIAGGLTCDYTLAQPSDVARENVGFRCCR